MGSFADGLLLWARGDDSDEGEAAGLEVAEILLHLKAYVTRGGGREE